MIEQEKRYTDDDIISEIKNIFPKVKTRKRNYVDQRNYLICILYYKFYYTEHMICDIFKGTGHELDRSTINHAKKSTIDLAKVEDDMLIDNIALLYNKFPFEFPSEVSLGPTAIRLVKVKLDLKTLGRVSQYANVNELTKHKAISYLLNNALDLIKNSKLQQNG
tara:strand:+ start:352 stop:843 length:492 start_codon:yes stop_codon:yes gene_type:complete